MEQFDLDRYYSRKKLLKLFGGEIKIFNEDESKLLFFIKQKAFKFKEDITVYTDENQSNELLKIQARSIIDFSAAYDVIDLRNNEKVGVLRRKGFSSLLKDKWQILNPNEELIGEVEEDNMLMALLRRFLTSLIPQQFSIVINGREVGELHQGFNPFVPQFKIDFSMDTDKLLDRRLGIATVILLQIIEGRQD